MSRSLNKATLIGNVGQDPTTRTLGNGNKVANFTVATSRSWKNAAGESQEKTEWHRIVVWGKLAEVVEKFVKKGEKIFVEGEIQYGSYDKNGVQVPTTEINANEVLLLGGNASAGRREPALAGVGASSDEGEGDLPF